MNKYSIEITEKAELDIKSAFNYIAEELGNYSAAQALLSETEKAIKSLSYMPSRNALIDDPIIADFGFRSLKVKNYLVFYILNENEKCVRIVRFLYARSDWQSLLKD